MKSQLNKILKITLIILLFSFSKSYSIEDVSEFTGAIDEVREEFNNISEASTEQSKIIDEALKEIDKATEYVQEAINNDNAEDAIKTLEFIEKSLSTEPPFFLSINANSKLSMLIEQDTIDTYTEMLYPGTEINLQGFVSKAKIIFSNTDNIKARLNGEELSIIENYPHPLKLIIQSSPPSISVRLFTPLN